MVTLGGVQKGFVGRVSGKVYGGLGVGVGLSGHHLLCRCPRDPVGGVPVAPQCSSALGAPPSPS